MKFIYLGILAVVLTGVFFAYQTYRGRDHRQDPTIISVPAPAAALKPQANLNSVKESTSAAGGTVGSTGKGPGDDWSVYRDIDRLKAEKSSDSVDALLKYLDHPKSMVKAHALKALREIASPRALPRLVAMLSEKGDVLAVRGTYMAIGGIGPNMTEPEERQLAVSGLKKSLEIYRDGSDQESRSNVYELIEAAGNIAGPESGEFLVSEFPKFHEDPLAQYSIVKSLGKIRYQPAEPILREFKEDLLKEGAEPWGDKELYADLLKAVNDSMELLTIRQN